MSNQNERESPSPAATGASQHAGRHMEPLEEAVPNETADSSTEQSAPIGIPVSQEEYQMLKQQAKYPLTSSTSTSQSNHAQQDPAV